MRILVAISHYFGPSHPENNLPAIGSYLEPMGRIAALNEAIVALKGQFGPNRFACDGRPLAAPDDPERRVDIVIVTMRDHNILPQLGFAEGTFETVYVDDKPPWIAFHAHKLLRERLGSYDIYCSMEDDLIIRDPGFFAKLLWFQREFGPKALLMPVRFEQASTGTPAKAVVDEMLPDQMIVAFRRAKQADELHGQWNGRRQTFRLAGNPHAGCFFLTEAQMRLWTDHSSFGDRDTSFAGPLESAVTLSVGKVFDIYKPAEPDPFFLEVLHFGVRYGAQAVPPGVRFGEPPLLAIAQNALRAALGNPAHGAGAGAGVGVGVVNDGAGSFAELVEQWIAQGTAVEHRARLDVAERQLAAQRRETDALATELQRLRGWRGGALHSQIRRTLRKWIG